MGAKKLDIDGFIKFCFLIIQTNS